MESVPTQIDRYRILEEVGRGGMAIVYRGLDASLDREVAVKVLHTHLAGEAESRARFQREARAVARLRHPHIIEIFDYADTGEGPSYIVTEFVEGQTLKEFMETHQGFFPEVAAMIGIQICQAIGHAHSLQIIHRDLKPENIMISREGQLKLMDFGIAKVIDQQQQMTLTGSIMGSPAHMAPELLEGKELDFRSDIFSLGTILYWLATGHLPFEGNNPHQVIKKIVQGVYPDPRQVNPRVGNHLARVIGKALEQSPEDRFQSISSMQSALYACLVEADLEDVDGELAFFFANPAGYLARLTERLVTRLLEDGKRALRSRQHRLALEHLDRVLALRPGHPEVMTLVDGIHRRVRLRRRMALAGVCLLGLILVGAGVWATLAWWPSAGGEPDAGIAGTFAGADAGRSTADAAAARDADAGPAPDGHDADEGVPDGASPPPADRQIMRPRRGDRGRIAKVMPRRPASHRVKIFTDPYFDRILVDEEVVAVNDRSTNYGQRWEGELEVGRHEVIIQRRSCQDKEFDIEVPAKPASDDELEFRKKLEFLPATLVIKTDLANVGVYVDAEFKGNAGDPIPITMEKGKGRRRVFLRLVDEKGRELRRQVRVAAGEREVVEAPGDAFREPGRGKQP